MDKSFTSLTKRYDFVYQKPIFKKIVVFGYSDCVYENHQCIPCCDFFTIGCQCTYCVAEQIYEEYDSAQDAYKDILVDVLNIDIENIIDRSYGGNLGKIGEHQYFLFWDTIENKMLLRIQMDWQSGWGGESNDNFTHLKSLIQSGFLRKDPAYQTYKSRNK